jgi:uncharacterized membrane protein YfcA
MNSAAALLGAYAWWDQIPSALPGWLIAVAVGGSLGAFIGSRYLPNYGCASFWRQSFSPRV